MRMLIIIIIIIMIELSSCTLVLYDGSKHNDRCDCPSPTLELTAAEENDRKVIRDALDHILSGDNE